MTNNPAADSTGNVGGDAATPAPPPASIKTVNNGPLQVKGAFQIVDHDGIRYDLAGRRTAFLCRCGHSKTKPFCDGAHAKIGFSTSDQAVPDSRADKDD